MSAVIDEFGSTLRSLTRLAAELVPGGRMALNIAEKVGDLVDDFTADQPDQRDVPQLKLDREQLRQRTSAKAQETADRLDG